MCHPRFDFCRSGSSSSQVGSDGCCAVRASSALLGAVGASSCTFETMIATFILRAVLRIFVHNDGMNSEA
ncbi:hypothetical protein BBBOND_0203450 [Babesia bigemina]|uniref:Uncharacterized protein n=1 Tax=Babesia bigemina TaxID=5866 RepID=A0A061D3M7_BABBI|nr:hypothetical protein BBBOND_0203450 [Babesia bigemina]CDR95188.1 hypothetical protein BBBOND_0203450 [Babesia bigemina]|eukprot:XP_012767374.1 hypothetical protein BBBOND_0203450 [Babesia bigemina]